MTNNSPLDEHIKKQFGDYSPDVPPHIWENIMGEKEKRKPAGFWLSFLNKKVLFLLFGILLLGGAGIIYKNMSASSKTTAETIPGSIEEPAITNNKTATSVAQENGNEKKSDIENSIQVEQHSSKTNINNPSEKNELPAVKNNTAGSYNKKTKLFVASSAGNKTSPDFNDNVIKTRPGKKSAKQKGSAALSFKAADTETTGEETGNTAANDLLLNRLLLNLDMLRATKTFDPSIKKINNPHLDIPCPTAEKNAAGNKKYLEIYAGPDYAFRSIKDTSNSVYLQKRKESTSFTSAFSAGLRYTRVFGNGMSFRTGINYSQINEKFKFIEGNIIQVVYVTNSNGDTTGSFTTTGTRYKTTHNKFRTLDVPILVGYELGNGRWHANFNAGAVVNVYSWQKGDVLDTAYQPVNITTGKSSSPYQFKTNVGIGFMGAVSVYYRLTDRLQLLAEPYFRYNFSPASKSDLTLKQKYNTAGIRLGVRIDL